MSLRKAFILSIFILVSSACSMRKDSGPTPETTQMFTRMKGLVGHWESQKDSQGNREKVDYRLRSGGSVLEEVLFPGSPHEMVSIYHPEQADLVMTHYCLLGNQPKLKAAKISENQYHFDFISSQSIDPKKEEHMHELKVTFLDKDHIKQEWTGYKEGKPGETKVIELWRKS